MPEPTPPAAAPAKKEETFEQDINGTKTTIKKSSVPVDPKELKGTPMDETVRIWARQAKQNIISLCTVKGCYYPLTAKRDLARGGDLDSRKDKDGKPYIAATCSWAGEEHGDQRIYPPKKEDEL